MRLVSDILSDTWDKLLRLMITMESNKQVIWMYSTLNRVLRKVWASLIAQGLKKKKKKSPPANAVGSIGKIPGGGNRKWQPAPVFLLGKSHA